MNEQWQEELKEDLDSAAAQVQMGQKCANGVGVVTDYVAAASHYENAARLGSARGKYELAKCYFYGAGVNQDFWRAKDLLCDSSEYYFLALRMLRKHYRGDGLVMQPDFSQFPGLQVKASKRDPAACTALGNCFFTGALGYKDYVAAAYWYREAAEKRDPEGVFALGYCYITGAGVVQDQDRGALLLNKAANMGFAPAIHNMNICFQCGCGIERDGLAALELQGDLEKMGFDGVFQDKLYGPKELWNDRRIGALSNMLYPDKNN